MNFGPTELIVILVIVLLLFGSTRLPSLARGMGKSISEFKKGISEGGKEDERAVAESRREKQLAAAAPEPRASLADVDDEALFEGARRRAAQRRAEETNRG